MDKQEIKKIINAYSIIFPELIESYYHENDTTIIDIIADKIIEKSKMLVDVNSIKNIIKNELNTS